MKNKGFTLIELLGVIVILGLITAFSIPALTKTLKDSANKKYNEYIKNIQIAAENYFHSETDGNLTENYTVTIGELVAGEYYKKEKNPKTNLEPLDSYVVVISKNEDGTEKYEFIESDNDTSEEND